MYHMCIFIQNQKNLIIGDRAHIEDITADETKMTIPKFHTGGRVGLDKLLISVLSVQDDSNDNASTNGDKNKHLVSSSIGEPFLLWDKSQLEEFNAVYVYVDHKEEGVKTLDDILDFIRTVDLSPAIKLCDRIHKKQLQNLNSVRYFVKNRIKAPTLFNILSLQR